MLSRILIAIHALDNWSLQHVPRLDKPFMLGQPINQLTLAFDLCYHLLERVSNDMDIKEATKRLGKSEKTVRRWIDAGKLKSKIVKGKYEIENLDISEMSNMTRLSNELAMELKAQLAELRKEKEQWQQERAELQKEIAESRRATEEANERHDMIVMQLTRQLEQSQRLLEHHQEPWYRRWFRKREQE